MIPEVASHEDLADFCRRGLSAAPASRDRRPVVADLLCPYPRPARRELRRWAADLTEWLDRLETSPAWSRAYSEGVVEVSNEAALIQALAGRLDKAEALCCAAIAYARRICETSGHLSLAHIALQPFINLGRLDRLRGAWEASLRKFRALTVLLDGGTATLPGFVVQTSHMAAIRRDCPGFVDRMQTNYVVDTLATLLRAKRHEPLLEWIASDGRGAEPSLRGFMWEALSIAIALRGDVELAEEAVTMYLRAAPPEEQPVFMYRYAELQAAAARGARARIACLAVSGHRTLWGDNGGNINLRLVLGVVRLTRDTSLTWTVLAERALGCAEAIGDVVGEQELLAMLLLDGSLSASAHRWRERLEYLEREAGYYRPTSNGSHTLPVPVEIDSLHERLIRLFSA